MSAGPSAGHAAGHAVIPIPGPSAVLAALSASGLPTDDFRFIGFLPAKDKARRDRLAAMRNEPSTLIAFESPHRLKATLAAIVAAMGGDRMVCVARELTKRFETVRTARAKDLSDQFGTETIKGEIAVLIAPASSERAAAQPADLEALLRELAAEMPAAKAAREAARLTGEPRADLYKRLLSMRDGDG